MEPATHLPWSPLDWLPPLLRAALNPSSFLEYSDKVRRAWLGMAFDAAEQALALGSAVLLHCRTAAAPPDGAAGEPAGGPRAAAPADPAAPTGGPR